MKAGSPLHLRCEPGKLNFKLIVYNIDIALLKYNIMSDKLAHDREMKDVEEALRSIAAKLDNIEQALRES